MESGTDGRTHSNEALRLFPPIPALTQRQVPARGLGVTVGSMCASPASPPPSSPTPSNLRTQNISIPSDMVGCIIGRGGSKITEIRRLSGSKISIAKAPHDETGERMFTIVGTPECNEKALFLLYNQLESEKERRVGRDASQQDLQD